MVGRVFDGSRWEDVDANANIGNTATQVPVPPAEDGDGTIFVSIPSFRDGQRCAVTIRSIFDNAKDPDKVFIGVIEQNDPEDVFCISAYCEFYGVKTINKRKIRDDVTKMMVVEGREEKCPRFHQIRHVAIFNIAASGPGGARALTRKVLGNEEYCLQIDSHMQFVSGWDALAKTEWKKTQNEFGILSTVPADMAEMSEYESWTGGKSTEVPRQCGVHIADNDIPEYKSPADGKAVGLETPLLSHAWSSAFSFSKCHIEETAPYDPFAQYVFGAEQFSRYARLWTRGYDVYTPTKNIVYHDYSPSEHGIQEWFKQRREHIRTMSLLRVKTSLGLAAPDGITMEVAHANLGIYGLGKQRSLQQLQEFIGIDLATRQSNKGNMKCGSKQWVPYDSSFSPMLNLYDEATDLDPQPEYPLRTEFRYFVDSEPDVDRLVPIENSVLDSQQANVAAHAATESNSPPFMMLLILWAFGLVVWCMLFVNNGSTTKTPRKRTFKKPVSGDKEV